MRDNGGPPLKADCFRVPGQRKRWQQDMDYLIFPVHYIRQGVVHRFRSPTRTVCIVKPRNSACQGISNINVFPVAYSEIMLHEIRIPVKSGFWSSVGALL